MPKYINLDKQLVRLYRLNLTYEDVVKAFLLSAETIDVPDRKVGKWECTDDIFEYALCSCCKWDSGEAWEYALKWFKFCPNCGAKMKGESDANDNS